MAKKIAGGSYSIELVLFIFVIVGIILILGFILIDRVFY